MHIRKNGLPTGFRAALFDLDGTLVDSMWMWPQIDVEYLARYGKEMNRGIQKDIEGMSFSETAVYFQQTIGIPESLEQIKADWIAMSLDKYAHEIPLKPYALDFLKLLKKNHIRTAIATSNYMEMVDACLDALSLRPYLDAVCTACEVAHGKPFPDIYLHAAACVETEPSDCLVFEDIPAGILAGKAAGMTVVAVEDDFSKPDEQEKRALADFYIKDYSVFLI